MSNRGSEVSEILSDPDRYPSSETLICPRCGSPAKSSSKVGQTCVSCGSELLPQPDALSLSTAERSYFDGCIPFHPFVDMYPGLGVLARNGERAFDFLKPVENSRIKNILEILSRAGKVKPEQRQYVEQKFFDLFYERLSLFRTIINLPDEHWRTCRGVDDYGMRDEPSLRKNTNLLASFGHPNGTYSTIRIGTRVWQSHHDIINISLMKLRRDPTSVNELEDLFVQRYLASERGVRAAIIEEENVMFSTEDLVHKHDHLIQGESGRIFNMLLGALPDDREKAIAYLQAVHTQLLTLKDGEIYSLWSSLCDLMVIWFAGEIREKLERVKSLTGGDVAPIRTPILDGEDVKLFDRNAYIDLSGQSEAISLNCQKCGAPIRGFKGQKSFFFCSACGATNDIVGSGRVLPEMIGNREYSDTCVPFEFVVESLLKIEESDQRGHDPDVIDTMQLLSVFAEDTLPESKEKKDYIIFQFVNAITKLAHRFPQFVSYFNVDGKYGYACSIEFPEKDSFTVQTKNGANVIEIPPFLRGKILVCRAGDFDQPRYSGTDYRYCFLRTSIHTKESIESIHTVQAWLRIMGEYQPRHHWLQGFSQLVGSGINYDQDTIVDRKSGRFYNLITDTLYLIPQGADLGTMFSHHRPEVDTPPLVIPTGIEVHQRPEVQPTIPKVPAQENRNLFGLFKRKKS